MNVTYKDQSLSISQVVRILSLDNKDWHSFSHAVLNSYKTKMDGKFKEFLDTLSISNDNIRKRITEHVSSLPQGRYSQFITSPSITKITRYNLDSRMIYMFGEQILGYARAENTRVGNDRCVGNWTPNGDFVLFEVQKKKYSEYHPFTLLDSIPLNFHSSQASSLTNGEMAEPSSSDILLYNFEEAEEIAELLDNSITFVSESELYAPFIRDFTSFIILNKVVPQNAQMKYFSGSNAEDVGRTVLSNAHIASKEIIVESVFHEAIHSMLYMIDNISQWQPDYNGHTQLKENKCIISPWSGNQLTIHSFLQACFVWFGIFFFWKNQLDEGKYSQQFIIERLKFVKEGFDKLIFDDIKLHAPSLIKDTENSINRMKRQVLAS